MIPFFTSGFRNKVSSISPTDIPSLNRWYADDIIYNSSFEVSSWRDKSGNNRHCTLNTLNTVPIIVNLNYKNGQPALVMGSGGSNAFNMENFDAKLGSTIFVVARRDNESIGSRQLVSASINRQFRITGTAVNVIGTNITSIGKVFDISDQKNDFIAMFEMNTLGEYRVGVWNSPEFSEVGTTAESTVIFNRIGARQTTFLAEPFQGEMMEQIFYNRVLTEVERNQVIDYLKTKFSL
jgi:hypothetical protein